MKTYPQPDRMWVGMAAVGSLWCATLGIGWATHQQPGPDSQAFFGSEYVGRFGELRTTERGDPEHGGWGPMVGKVEFYVGGEWQPEADCAIECQVTLFDADGDGRLTLRDYQEFQNAFGQ